MFYINPTIITIKWPESIIILISKEKISTRHTKIEKKKELASNFWLYISHITTFY